MLEIKSLDAISLFNKAFALLVHGTEASGGDGHGRLICHYYNFMEVADAFEKYYMHNRNKPLKRTQNGDEIILIPDNYEQEGYSICASGERHQFDDICIIL